MYFFPDCSLLDAKAQNVLLKVVEEGPAHAAFIFCARNSAVLLQTIRSRCVEWNLGGEAEQTEETGAAGELCALLDRKDAMALSAWLTGLETGKMKREELQALLEQAGERMARSLLAASGCGGQNCCPHLSRRQMNDATDVLREYARQLRFNLSVGHVTGALAVALSDVIRRP